MIASNLNPDVNLCDSCNRISCRLRGYFDKYVECDEYEYKGKELKDEHKEGLC